MNNVIAFPGPRPKRPGQPSQEALERLQRIFENVPVEDVEDFLRANERSVRGMRYLRGLPMLDE
jgi:hypothetical protein